MTETIEITQKPDSTWTTINNFNSKDKWECVNHIIQKYSTKTKNFQIKITQNNGLYRLYDNKGKLQHEKYKNIGKFKCNQYLPREISRGCPIEMTPCYFPDCEHDEICQKSKEKVNSYLQKIHRGENIQENKNILKNIKRYQEYDTELKVVYTDKEDIKERYTQELKEIEEKEKNIRSNKEEVFKDICTDITTIFMSVDAQRPYIAPIDNGVYISIGDDDYGGSAFPVSTQLFNLLNDYFGIHGVFNITNNSLGDAFEPNLSITYEF